MKFVDTIKTDITWLVVQGTDPELDKLVAWTEKHRTMYVIAGKRAPWIPEVGSKLFQSKQNNNPNATIVGIRARMNGELIMIQRFGFKAASDALRCKLSLA